MEKAIEIVQNKLQQVEEMILLTPSDTWKARRMVLTDVLRDLKRVK